MEPISRQTEIANANINDLGIHKEVKGLQSGKSRYLDEILNDALKTGYEEFKWWFVHLFNIIYDNSVYLGTCCDVCIISIPKLMMCWMPIISWESLSPVILMHYYCM